MRNFICSLMSIALSITIAAGFLLVVPAPVSSSPADFVLIYTGDGRGEVEPVGCCSKIGGMARRAAFIEGVRKENEHVLVVDSGDFLWHDRLDPVSPLKALHIRKAFDAIGYDALNIADAEIASLEHTYRFLKDSDSFKAISLNVRPHFPTDEGITIYPYIVKKVNGVRIAIAGLTSRSFFGKTNAWTSDIESEEEALAEKLPEIKNVSDIVVLLSHAGWEKTLGLVQRFDGIDVAIVAHEESYEDYASTEENGTLLVRNAPQGVVVGIVRFWIDKEGLGITRRESRLVVLDQKIVPTAVQADLEASFVRDRKESFKHPETIDHRKYLSLTPEQFFEQMKKENRLVMPIPQQ